MMMYCLNLIANIADAAEFPKHITPFEYREGAFIIANDKPSLIYAKKNILSQKNATGITQCVTPGAFFSINIFTICHRKIRELTIYLWQ